MLAHFQVDGSSCKRKIKKWKNISYRQKKIEKIKGIKFINGDFLEEKSKNNYQVF